jgi:peptide-methionine (S)-S-oxide reductase
MNEDPLVGLAELDGTVLAAVSAIDRGDVRTLDSLLSAGPSLVAGRFPCGGGYFHRPYLLWFVAGNPVRLARLPNNAADVASTIMGFLVRYDVASRNDQIDHTLSLVCSGRVPRESGVQAGLIDVLIDAGGDPDGAMNPALAHREEAAVRHLVERGARVTLSVAAATGRTTDLRDAARSADASELQAALAVAAIWGQADSVRALAAHGPDLDAHNPSGLHAHGTALHNAVAAHSLETVRALIEAGAKSDIRDTIWDGTALDWAEHLGDREIARYLRAGPPK